MTLFRDCSFRGKLTPCGRECGIDRIIVNSIELLWFTVFYLNVSDLLKKLLGTGSILLNSAILLKGLSNDFSALDCLNFESRGGLIRMSMVDNNTPGMRFKVPLPLPQNADVSDEGRAGECSVTLDDIEESRRTVRQMKLRDSAQVSEIFSHKFDRCCCQFATDHDWFRPCEHSFWSVDCHHADAHLELGFDRSPFIFGRWTGEYLSDDDGISIYNSRQQARCC